jgi:hypothetical protein
MFAAAMPAENIRDKCGGEMWWWRQKTRHGIWKKISLARGSRKRI